MNINKKLQEIQKEIDELNDKILKVRKGEIKTGLGIERDSALIYFLELSLKDVLIEYNDEFDKTYSKGSMSDELLKGFVFTGLFLFGVLMIITMFNKTSDINKDAEINQSNISAYEEEQKQIYEAKIKGVK